MVLGQNCLLRVEMVEKYGRLIGVHKTFAWTELKKSGVISLLLWQLNAQLFSRQGSTLTLEALVNYRTNYNLSEHGDMLCGALLCEYPTGRSCVSSSIVADKFCLCLVRIFLASGNDG